MCSFFFRSAHWFASLHWTSFDTPIFSDRSDERRTLARVDLTGCCAAPLAHACIHDITAHHFNHCSNCMHAIDDMSGGQNNLLLAMDIAKVDGPLSVVKVFTQNWTSQVRSLLLGFSANFAGYSCSMNQYGAIICSCWLNFLDASIDQYINQYKSICPSSHPRINMI